MATAKKRGNLLQFALIFAAVYLGSQLVLQMFFPDKFNGDKKQTQGIELHMVDDTVKIGHHPELEIKNNEPESGRTVTLTERCPDPPLNVYYVEGAGTGAEKFIRMTATGAVTGCAAVLESLTVTPGNTAKISLAPWKYTLFSRLGTYEVRVPAGAVEAAPSTGTTASGAIQTKDVLTARVEMQEAGPFTQAFRVFIMKPFLNALIFIASLLPGYNLGFAIIILTIIVKLILYIPTKHALEGQKKMQLLQPKLEELKKRYPGDAKKVQEETMKLWAEHKINPFQSCLPTLIQFPILIGLFYVIRDGSVLELSRHLIYPMYQHLNWGFNTNFFGLDLLKPSYYLMPPLLVVMQFLQMKLAFTINDRKKAKQNGVIDVTPKGEKKKEEPASAQQLQQKVMLYGLQLMIGFFAFQFPAAVSLYWGISTLFGIGQQVLVNREHLTVKT